MEADIEKNFKVVLLGDNYIGTTSLLRRFINHEYDPYKYSYNTYTSNKNIILENGKKISFQFWDIYNPERYYSLNQIYIRNSHGVMLTYDITKRSSFESVNYRLNNVRDNFKGILVIALVGLKIDSYLNEEVSEEEARYYAEDNNILFYLTSARDNIDVDNCFNGIMNEIIRKNEIINENKYLTNLNNIKRERPSKRGCLK